MNKSSEGQPGQILETPLAELSLCTKYLHFADWLLKLPSVPNEDMAISAVNYRSLRSMREYRQTARPLIIVRTYVPRV